MILIRIDMNSKLMAIISIVLIATLNIANASAISKPDLVASLFDASITNTTIKSGSLICNVNIDVIVRNEGNLTSTLTPVIIRDLTTDTVIFNNNVGQLDPNAEKSITFTNVKLQGAGVHKLVLEINPVVNATTNFRLIDEFDTSNNSIEEDVLCQILAPDLTITALKVSIITEPEGDKLQVDYSVKNIGNFTSNGGAVSLFIKDIVGPNIGSSAIGPLLPNEEKEFTVIRDITGEITVFQKEGSNITRGKNGIPLQIGKEHEIIATVVGVSPSEINTSNNAMKREFTYTTLPRAGLFITPLASHSGPISIQLCAEEPLRILSAAIIAPIGNTYYNLEQAVLDIGECHVLYSQDFKDLNDNEMHPGYGLYTIIVDTDKGPIYGEYVGESFFTLPESFIGAVGITGAIIGVFIAYNIRKRTSL